jgi:hypothetical protein
MEKNLFKLSVVPLLVLTALVVTGCIATQMPLKLSDGGTVLMADLPTLNNKYARNAYRKNFEFSRPKNPLCPLNSSWDRKGKSEGRCTSFVKERFPGIDQYIDGGCDCEVVFTVGRELLLPVDRFSSELKHSPVSILLEKPNGKRDYIRGIVETESATPTNQDVTLFNNKGKEVCKGSQHIKANDDGEFQLQCFGGVQKVVGLTSMRTSVIDGRRYTYGSGLFENKTRFVFVTRYTTEGVKKAYPDFFKDM